MTSLVAYLTKTYSKKARFISILALLLAIYTAIILLFLESRSAIRNLDFWYHLSVGQRLQWDAPQTLVNGLYPLGYPFLLSLATQADIDALFFGRFLSWGGGLLLLSACFSLIYLLTRHLIFATLGTLLLLSNIHFLTHATYEGNDMLAAGLQAISIALLWYGTFHKGPKCLSKRLLILHGMLLGFAYLTRYTALILLPISLLFVSVRYHSSRKAQFQALVLILLSFFITTSIQLIPSWQLHQTLFYTEQAKNVWFGIYGGYDWVNNWGKMPNTIGLLEVIDINPSRFFQHWLLQLRSAFVSLRFWPWPFHIAWIFAIPVFAFARRHAFSQRLFLLILLLLPLGITALAWLSARFLLFSLCIEAIFIGWLACHLSTLFPSYKRINGFIIGSMLFAATLFFQWPTMMSWLDTPPMRRPQEVNHFLRMAGMDEIAQVATNDPYLHRVDRPARSRYVQTYGVNPKPGSVEEILSDPAVENWDYLVLDYQDGFGDYTHLRDAFRQEKSRLAPLALSNRRDIFCLLPCLSDEFEPLVLTFDNGILLEGYRQHGTKHEGSLYLYWQSTDALLLSYKISVRLVDASGSEVAQIDNIPQLWSYPTTDWLPDRTVVDFYSWQLEAPCEDCQIALLIYEEDSQEPLFAMTEGGESVGPLIHLQN